MTDDDHHGDRGRAAQAPGCGPGYVGSTPTGHTEIQSVGEVVLASEGSADERTAVPASGRNAPAVYPAELHGLPEDKRECKAALDAACLQLWGGTEWEKKRRRRKVMPEAWKLSTWALMIERRAARGEAA